MRDFQSATGKDTRKKKILSIFSEKPAVTKSESLSFVSYAFHALSVPFKAKSVLSLIVINRLTHKSPFLTSDSMSAGCHPVFLKKKFSPPDVRVAGRLQVVNRQM